MRISRLTWKSFRDMVYSLEHLVPLNPLVESNSKLKGGNSLVWTMLWMV